MQVAVAVLLVLRRWSIGFAPVGWFDLVATATEVILFVGSRDTLRKYYWRVSQLLGNVD